MKRESKFRIEWIDGSKDELRDFVKLLLDRVDNMPENARIQFHRGEIGDIINDAGAELKEVNGVMEAVGGQKKEGEAYELKFSIWEEI